MTNTDYFKYGLAIIAILSVVFLIVTYRTQTTYGSVSVTNEYIATSTAKSTVYGGTISGDKLIKTGGGVFGSVIITGAGTGVINIYNATTTDKTKRTGNTATTTLLLASFPASAAAGTYTFDVGFSTGLLVDIVSGNMATSTITYR